MSACESSAHRAFKFQHPCGGPVPGLWVPCREPASTDECAMSRLLLIGVTPAALRESAAGQAAVLGSAPASCAADTQCREAHRQRASSTGSTRQNSAAPVMPHG